ncbi:MAG: MBL fold metallo-hydrolase [Candidatus Omnitrophica bacterium]|nr:MBL fold metallo-hydrolase [Candidatus Omnitrophota bacterium]
MSTRPIYLKQLELGSMQNFIYLLGDPTTKEAAVIDPGWEAPSILRAAEQDGYRLTGAILTHTHFDHVMGLEPLLKVVDMPVYVHEAEKGLLKIAVSSLKPVKQGDTIQIGSLPVTLIHTPGHTPGSQCLLVDDQLLSGDTLFIRACGRCDLPGGDPRALYNSLMNTLRKLDERTAVYPGHNYADIPTSTIGQEKQQNPFLKVPTVEDFLHLVGAD